MKKNKMAMISVTFILGAVFGISLIALFSFVRTPNPPSPNPPLTIISTVEANKLFHNYYDFAVPMKDKLKGFYIDRPQLDALNELARNSNLVGFRIYLGKTAPNGDTLSIIVGATNRMLDDVTATNIPTTKVYKIESRNTGPCPPLCGVESPITK
jgi:hypothetical protein